MFEKIKDFLYDISDIVLSLLIIGLIFFAVSWKISDTLSMDVDPPTDSAIETTTGSPISVTPVESTDASIESTEESTEATTEATTEPTTEAATEAPKLENFVVADGELGYTIGKNLESQGFVADSDDFVKRLIEMGYDSKLRSGTYKISKSDSLDTIIKVLAGQGRN
ncbi:MAG: hypothetical protein BGO41_02875 [Clostridiales bacterium 38-18]|nr:MAG: hypothetical protein BGO41_02875 [Clostridiales bacterium 38-18]